MIDINDMIRIFLAICGGISCVGAAGAYAAKVFGWIRKPERDQNDKIAEHGRRINRLEEKADRDYREIEEIKKQIYLLLNAQLASMSYQVDQTDDSELKLAQKSIEDYIRNKATLGR